MSGVCEKIEASKSPEGGGLLDIKYSIELISREKLLLVWEKFFAGKKHQPAVQKFWLNLEAELQSLYHDLSVGSYQHRPYRHFVICDPKRRDIYVASVRDRLVHQLVFDYLDDIYEPRFYFHSYASRRGKGLHRARGYFLRHYERLSRSGRVWAVKMDVRKFFSNICHDRLLDLLVKSVSDQFILSLAGEIIGSFGQGGQGLPLGNLTSQILANIYLHEADFYIKNTLRIKYYLRYNDDLIFLSPNRELALDRTELIQRFVKERLELDIPPSKISIASPPQIIDVLGLQTDGWSQWLRPRTKRRAAAKLAKKALSADEKLLDSFCSYQSLPADGGLFDWQIMF